MSACALTVALYVIVGAGPFGHGGCATCNNGGFDGYASGGYTMPAGGYPVDGYGGGFYGGGGVGGGSVGGAVGGSIGGPPAGDQLYPFDSPEPWLHGYYQDMSAYAGYSYFLPFNYRHVLAQSQAAGGWGMAPNMPYSQQWWHRYEARARMQKPAGVAEPNTYGAALPAGQPLVTQQAVQPEGDLSAIQVVDPAAYDQSTRMLLLQQQLQQQRMQIQALQNALQQQPATTQPLRR